MESCGSASQACPIIHFSPLTLLFFRLIFAGTFSVCASRFIVADGQIEDASEVQLQKSYLVSSGQRSRSPVCSNYPSVGCNWGGMDEVNWLEWIVLRCEPKTDTDGNMVEVVVGVGGGGGGG